MDKARELLRHTVATVAYRATRALENTDGKFGDYGGAVRRPVEILAHMSDLFDWALSMAEGQPVWHSSEARSWDEERLRFYAALAAFDDRLAAEMELAAPADRLFQGPVADALTHVGQLAMLRRLAGVPAHGENFYVAEIACGCVGAGQPVPVKPF
jgi:hypothetical protein